MSAELPALPQRDQRGHKGTFGTVGVIGGVMSGDRMMLGGPAFAALGALRSGAGLAVLAVPEPILAEALTIAPSATGLALPVDEQGAIRPSEAARLLDAFSPGWDALAVGPGLGVGSEQEQVVARLIARDDVPLVIDADALNALAAMREVTKDFRCEAVLTPHPGEFRRIAPAVGVNVSIDDEPGRIAGAEQLAQRLGCVVVLKGERTVISDGLTTHVNTSGNAALATGGTGDVLTGVIAGFVAQFFKRHLGMGVRQVTATQQGGLSLLDCARLGVFVHGRAADRWAARHGTAGMLAMDLLEEVPLVLAEMRGEAVEGPLY